MAASKLQNKRLVKYVNINIRQIFLVQIIFKVSIINMTILQLFSFVQCGHRMSKHDDATILTGGIIYFKKMYILVYLLYKVFMVNSNHIK